MSQHSSTSSAIDSESDATPRVQKVKQTKTSYPVQAVLTWKYTRVPIDKTSEAAIKALDSRTLQKIKNDGDGKKRPQNTSSAGFEHTMIHNRSAAGHNLLPFHTLDSLTLCSTARLSGAPSTPAIFLKVPRP